MIELRRIVILLAALAALVFAGLVATSGRVLPADAPPANRLDAILARGTLRVGTTGDFRPFSYYNQKAQVYEGVDIEMAHKLADALGVKLELVETSWPNLMGDLAADRFDIAMGGITVTLDRQKTALFSSPVLTGGRIAIARCADKDKFRTLAAIDRGGVRVITNPGGNNERFDRATLKHATIVVYPDNRTIWQQVLDGQADLMITDSAEVEYWQKQHPGLCAVAADHPFDFNEKAYLLPRDLIWKAFVDQWLQIESAKGTFKAIYAAWMK